MIVKEIRLYTKNDTGFLLTLLSIVAFEILNLLSVIDNKIHYDLASFLSLNLDSIQFPVFLIMIYMTIQVCRYHDLDTVWILRYQNRRHYIGRLFKKFWIHNSIVYFFIILITCLISYITFLMAGSNNSLFVKTYLQGLGIWYCLFQTIEYFLLMQLLLSIFVLLLKYLPKIISYLSLLVILFLSFSPLENVPIHSIKDIILTPNGYFYQQRFSSFLLQIELSIIYFIFLGFLVILLYRLLRHRKFDIG